MRVPWKERLAAVLGIDPRALAALRIGLALVLLGDLARRLADFTVFHTDAGVLPGEILPQRAWETILPLHSLSGSPAYQAALFGLAALFAVLMLVGLYTRVSVVASWALLLSLHGRTAMVGDYGDEMLRQVLFWCMFLPLGRCGSLDARRRPPPDRAPVVSVGSAGLLLQIASIYFFTALLKSGPDWRVDGSAIEVVLQRDWGLRPMGALLLEHFRGLLRAASFAVLAFEFWGPLLLFSPFATRRLRIGVVYLAWLFQLGLGLCLVLGLMPWINSVMVLAFLPPAWWDGMARRFGRERPAAAPPGPAPAPWRRRADAAAQLVAAACLAYVLAINVAGLRAEWRLPEPIERIGYYLRLEQRWAMFTPNAPRDDGWYIIPGLLRSGHWVDLWPRSQKLTWKKPEPVSSQHRSHRWFVYQMRLHEKIFDAPPYLRFRREYAEWLCEGWNRVHSGEDELLRVSVFWVAEPTRDSAAPPDPEPALLLDHDCFGSELAADAEPAR